MLNDIIFLEALGDYVKVHINNKSIIVHDTFRNLFSQLPENQFVRVHKSFAISLNKIETIEGNMVKVNDKLIPVGHTYRNAFIRLIKLRSDS